MISLNSLFKKRTIQKPIYQLTEDEFLEFIKTSKIDSKLILKNDILRKSSKILNTMLDYDKLCYKYFLKEAFTFDIVRKIINLNTSYYFDSLDILPILNDNEKIIIELITLYPSLIVSLRNISNYIEKLAIESGYIPNMDDLVKNKELITCKLIISKGFEQDPRFIRFFSKEMLTQNVVISLKIRNYILTEEDLKFNQYLCGSPDLMYNAIKQNPRLIIYIAKTCYLPNQFLEYIDTQYLITSEDIKHHPEIVENQSIVQAIPRLLKYSNFITYEQKLKIVIKILLGKLFFNEDNAPFLENKKEPIDLNLLNQLIKKINYMNKNLIDADYNLKELINQISNLRYENSKSKFKFQDIVKLNDYINEMFEDNKIDILTKDIFDFTSGKLDIKYLTKKIREFYIEYQKNNYIGLEKTGEFCNTVLNIHRNNYMNKERKKIIEQIKQRIPLSLKKEKTIKTRFKLKILTQYIKKETLDLIYISKEDIIKNLYDVLEILKNNKRIKQEKIDFKNYNQIIEYFLKNGTITKEIVTQILDIKNNEVAKYIAKKIKNIRLKYIDKVSSKVIDYHSIKQDLALNSSNFMILSEDIFLNNLAHIILNLDNETAKKFTCISNITFFIYCLYFINLIDDFDTNDYLNIISNYNKIMDKLNISEILFSNLNSVLFLSNCYASNNSAANLIFGENVVNLLDYGINEYLEFYKYMLCLTESNIPPVNLDIDDKLYISGQHDNPDRLLIGKGMDFLSCIDLLDSSGCDTYKEALSKPTGDVILIYENGKLNNRILVFRRGNVIQLITSLCQKLSIDDFILIAEDMVKKIKDDNLDFILVNTSSVKEEKCNLKIINDYRINKLFPHADKNSSVYVLYQKNKILNYNASIQGIYKKIRRPVLFKPKSSQITRLRILDILLEIDLELRKEKTSKFEPFIKDDYKVWISGEDWYLAIRKNDQIEEFFLPIATNESYNEMENAKENIIKKLKL